MLELWGALRMEKRTQRESRGIGHTWVSAGPEGADFSEQGMLLEQKEQSLK